MSINRPQSKQPIPPHAKHVYQGHIFQVFQWDQEMYDGSSAIFEKIVRPDTVSILPITLDNKIILTKQSQPSIEGEFYSPVGGVVDPGEDPLTAAKRELQEETGYSSDTIELWYAFQGSYKVDWALYMFVAKNCVKRKDQQLDAGEKIEVLEVDFDEFFKIATRDNFRDKELSLRLLREYYSDATMKSVKQQLGII